MIVKHKKNHLNFESNLHTRAPQAADRKVRTILITFLY